MDSALFFLSFIFLISIFAGTLCLILSEPKKKTYSRKATEADQERLYLESFKSARIERLKREREEAVKIHASTGPTQQSEAISTDQSHLNQRLPIEKARVCPFCVRVQNTNYCTMSQDPCIGDCKGEVKDLPCPSASCNNTVQRFTILQGKFKCWHCYKAYNSQYEYENYEKIVYAWAHKYRYNHEEDRVEYEFTVTCPFCQSTDCTVLSKGHYICPKCKGEIKNLPCPFVSCGGKIQRFTILQGKYGCWHCQKVYASQYEYENYDQILYAQNLNKESQTEKKSIINERTARPLSKKIPWKNDNEEKIDANTLQHDFLSYFQHPPFPQRFPFTIKLPKRYCLEKGCIIDLETTSFSPLSGHIVTMGVLEKDKAIVYQLTVPNYEEFRVFCFQKARETQEPRFSYNARFESEFLQMEHCWVDLMQYRRVDRFSVCTRGLKIAKAKESQIIEIDNFNYKVRSESSDRWYAVDLSGEPWNWSCECDFYNTFFERCKHIWAVGFAFKGLDMEHVKRADLFTEFRKSLGQCTSSAFEEPAIRGGSVPRIWQQWLDTNKPEILANITLHCLSDLLRERQLVKE